MENTRDKTRVKLTAVVWVKRLVEGRQGKGRHNMTYEPVKLPDLRGCGIDGTLSQDQKAWKLQFVNLTLPLAEQGLQIYWVRTITDKKIKTQACE